MSYFFPFLAVAPQANGSTKRCTAASDPLLEAGRIPGRRHSERHFYSSFQLWNGNGCHDSVLNEDEEVRERARGKQFCRPSDKLRHLNTRNGRPLGLPIVRSAFLRSIDQEAKAFSTREEILFRKIVKTRRSISDLAIKSFQFVCVRVCVRLLRMAALASTVTERGGGGGGGGGYGSRGDESGGEEADGGSRCEWDSGEWGRGAGDHRHFQRRTKRGRKINVVADQNGKTTC